MRCEFRAEQFLVTLEQALALGGTGRAPEELLVSEDESGMEVALYLAPELLAAMGDMNPQEAVDGATLPGFCTVVEGVSHFLYLSRSLALERNLTLLELEAQAEIDKFATCVLLRWGTPHWASSFFKRLFDDASFRADMERHERWRYEEANRLSRNFCLGLMQHVRQRRMDRFLAELRYAYRLGAEAKLRHLSNPLSRP